MGSDPVEAVTISITGRIFPADSYRITDRIRHTAASSTSMARD